MTIKELLDSVTFEEVVPYLIKSEYDKRIQGWYKIHYDMLRLLTPSRHDDKDAVCEVSIEYAKGSGKPCIRTSISLSHDMPWEHLLSIELHLGPDFCLSKAELACFCIEDTTFWLGYDEYNKDFKVMPDDIKRNIQIINQNGGYVVALRDWSPGLKRVLKKVTQLHYPGWKFALRPNSKGRKAKWVYRKVTLLFYYEIIWHISRFIVLTIPALKDKRNDMDLTRLCRLFFTEEFYDYTHIRSYADENKSGADYILELIDKYHILANNKTEKPSGIVLVMTTGSTDSSLSASEKNLCDKIIEGYKYQHVLLATDSSLGNQIEVKFIEYESKESLLENNSLVVDKPLLASTIQDCWRFHSKIDWKQYYHK